LYKLSDLDNTFENFNNELIKKVTI